MGGLAELWVHNCWQKRIFGPNLPKGVKHDNNLAVFEIVCRISGSFRVDILLSSGRETDVFISQPFWPRCRDPTSQLSKNLPTGKPPTASHYFSLSHLLSPAKLQLNIPPVNLNMVGSTIRLDYIHIIRKEVWRAPTSRWRPFGPLNFVLCALWAFRPYHPRQSDMVLTP